MFFRTAEVQLVQWVQWLIDKQSVDLIKNGENVQKMYAQCDFSQINLSGKR